MFVCLFVVVCFGGLSSLSNPRLKCARRQERDRHLVEQFQASIRKRTNDNAIRRECIAWVKSRHFTTPLLVSMRKDVWKTNAEILYRWRVTTQIWVVLLIGRSKFSTNNKHYPDLGGDASYEITAGASRSVGCLFRRRNSRRRRKERELSAKVLVAVLIKLDL